MLNIDSIRSNPNQKIKMTLPKGKVVNAFMVQDTFAINGSNQFEDLFSLGNISSKIQTVSKMLSKGTSTLTGTAHKMAKHRKETRQAWVGAEKPTFSLQLMFVATKADDDIREEVFKVLEGVYPEEGTGGIISAPWGYGFGTGGKSGKFTISIGKWFSAPNQILNDASFELSKETTKKGWPLYATGTINFFPYRLIYAKELKKYFKGM